MNPGPFLPPHTVQERGPIIRCFIGKDGLKNGDAFDYKWIVCKQNNLLFLTGGCFYVGACSTIRFVLEAEHYLSLIHISSPSDLLPIIEQADLLETQAAEAAAWERNAASNFSAP